jgi:hypothetical protein
MSSLFFSASSSLLTLARPALEVSLAGPLRAIVSSGSGLTANRINLPYASELYLAFDLVSSVLLDQRFAIDPRSPSWLTSRSAR